MAEITEYSKDILSISELDLPWEELNGCNILITGATGLIGSSLVDALMMNPKRSYHVYASGRDLIKLKHRFKRFEGSSEFTPLQIDVTVPLINDIHFDYVIHAASPASPNFFAQHPVEVMKANITGVVNLVEYGIKHGMKRLLYISSGEVYGEGDGRIFTEEYSGYVDITSPRSCYPSSKRASETLCASYIQEYNADIVIARPCHIYGPDFTDSDNRVYAQFIRNIIKDEDILMKSNGEQFRSWCYVVDCVSALLYVLLKGEKGNAYNIADEQSTISIKELAEMIAKCRNKKVKTVIPDIKEKKGYNVVTKSVFSTKKISELGWKVKNGSINDKLRKTVDNLLYNK